MRFLDCEESISACPDLVGAQIEIRKSLNYQNYCEEFCDSPRGGSRRLRCLNITRGTCTIYIGFRSSPEARRHEVAHCRGYNHTWDGSSYVVPDARDFAVQPRGYEAKEQRCWIMRILQTSKMLLETIAIHRINGLAGLCSHPAL